MARQSSSTSIRSSRSATICPGPPSFTAIEDVNQLCNLLSDRRIRPELA